MHLEPDTPGLRRVRGVLYTALGALVVWLLGLAVFTDWEPHREAYMMPLLAIAVCVPAIHSMVRPNRLRALLLAVPLGICVLAAAFVIVPLAILSLWVLLFRQAWRARSEYPSPVLRQRREKAMAAWRLRQGEQPSQTG